MQRGRITKGFLPCFNVLVGNVTRGSGGPRPCRSRHSRAWLGSPSHETRTAPLSDKQPFRQTWPTSYSPALGDSPRGIQSGSASQESESSRRKWGLRYEMTDAYLAIQSRSDE